MSAISIGELASSAVDDCSFSRKTLLTFFCCCKSTSCGGGREQAIIDWSHDFQWMSHDFQWTSHDFNGCHVTLHDYSPNYVMTTFNNSHS